MELNRETLRKIMGLLLFAALLLSAALNINQVMESAGSVLGLFTPFIIGGVMAMILNVIMHWIEKRTKLNRGLSLLLSLFIVFGLIAFLMLLVIPEFVNTVEMVSKRVPEAVKQFETWIDGAGKRLPIDLPNLEIDWNKVFNTITEMLQKGSSAVFKSTIGITTSIFSAFFNGLLGLVFAIYVLLQKEQLGLQFKKILHAFLKEDTVAGILAVGGRAHSIFSNFVTGQFTEALIIGGLCFVGMLILSMPYALVISALVGFTALIPVFGAFIGTGIGAFLILMVNPIKALWFILFIVVLQQLEGNLIYPKVVGSSIGLPGIWVLAAVTIGGAAYGVVGMLAGVPLASLIYSLIRDFVNMRLKQKKIEL